MKNELFYEYEQILIGQKDRFSSKFFKNMSDREKEASALKIFQIAIENYLHLSPHEAKEQINKELIEKMKLNLVLPYIQFPIEFDSEKDFFYILSLLYPNVIKINENEKILHYYIRILETNGRFVKGYFMQEDGKKKARICLKYAISQELHFSSVEDLYLLFAGSKEKAGRKFLKQYKLDHYCYDLYETKIDFLHDALPESQKNQFLYYYYKYKAEKSKLSARFKEIPGVYTIDRFPEGISI